MLNIGEILRNILLRFTFSGRHVHPAWTIHYKMESPELSRIWSRYRFRKQEFEFGERPRRLGQGGEGIVYQAEHAVLGKVAIKQLNCSYVKYYRLMIYL